MLSENAALLKDERSAKRRDTMQHRHFAIIARIITDLPLPQRKEVAMLFALKLGATNESFDYGRFMRACNA